MNTDPRVWSWNAGKSAWHIRQFCCVLCCLSIRRLVDPCGEWQASYCLSEPGSGSDAFALATRATLDGDVYRLTGSKMWITGGAEAGLYLLFATIDSEKGYKGIMAFLVERDTPGFSIGKREDKLGIRASETAQVHFEECRVHQDMMLGGDQPGAAGGLGDTKKMLDSTRPVVGAQAVGGSLLVQHFIAKSLQRVVDAAQQFQMTVADALCHAMGCMK